MTNSEIIRRIESVAKVIEFSIDDHPKSGCANASILLLGLVNDLKRVPPTIPTHESEIQIRAAETIVSLARVKPGWVDQPALKHAVNAMRSLLPNS